MDETGYHDAHGEVQSEESPYNHLQSVALDIILTTVSEQMLRVSIFKLPLYICKKQSHNSLIIEEMLRATMTLDHTRDNCLR